MAATLNTRQEYQIRPEGPFRPDLWTPLHKVTRKASLAMVALLLDRGADPTLRDNHNRLPVDIADYNKALQGTDVYWRLNEARY